MASPSRIFSKAPAGSPVSVAFKIEAATAAEEPEGPDAVDACPVCYGLDPSQAPKSGSTSWAALEYNIPTTTTVGKFTVTKPEEFARSAEEGCLCCHVIRLMLETAYPGWEEEPAIVHIHLAVGLPVVIRLEFGRMVTDLLDEEKALRHTGLVVPKGVDSAKVSLAIYYPGYEAIELEIYRPRQDRGKISSTWKPASPCSRLLTSMHGRYHLLTS